MSSMLRSALVLLCVLCVHTHAHRTTESSATSEHAAADASIDDLYQEALAELDSVVTSKISTALHLNTPAPSKPAAPKPQSKSKPKHSLAGKAHECVVVRSPTSGEIMTDEAVLQKVRDQLAAKSDKRTICDLNVTAQLISKSTKSASPASISGSSALSVSDRVRVLRAELSASKQEMQQTWVKSQKLDLKHKEALLKLVAKHNQLKKLQAKLKSLKPAARLSQCIVNKCNKLPDSPSNTAPKSKPSLFLELFGTPKPKPHNSANAKKFVHPKIKPKTAKPTKKASAKPTKKPSAKPTKKSVAKPTKKSVAKPTTKAAPSTHKPSAKPKPQGPTFKSCSLKCVLQFATQLQK